MSIYPKRLRNLKSLEQEKKKLLKEKKRLDDQDILLLGGRHDKDGDENGAMGWLLEMLPISNPVVNMLIKLVQSRLAKKKKIKETEEREDNEGGHAKRNILLDIAKEVLGGYLKWKAIELSYKGIKMVIKKRREEKKDKAGGLNS